MLLSMPSRTIRVLTDSHMGVSENWGGPLFVGPYSKGIPLFKGLYSESLLFVNPHICY